MTRTNGNAVTITTGYTFITVDDLELDDLLGELDSGGNGYRGRSGGGGDRKGKPPQRPKTSRGQEAPFASDRRLSTLSTDSDLFFPLEGAPNGLHKEDAAATKERNVLSLEAPLATAKQGGSAPSSQSRQSTSLTDDVFDDVDVDFLSDMGLGDEGSKSHPPLTTTATRKKSVVSATPIDESECQPTDKLSGSDDFFSSLGKRLNSSSMQEPNSVTGIRTKHEEGGNGESDGLQFGGYVPSSAGGRKSSLKQQPEASVSKEDSVNQLNNMSVRPNTAPGKKAVRFAEELTTTRSPRPATTPSLQLSREGEDSEGGETGPRSSVGVLKRRSTISDFTFAKPDPRFVFTAPPVCACTKEHAI